MMPPVQPPMPPQGLAQQFAQGAGGAPPPSPTAIMPPGAGGMPQPGMMGAGAPPPVDPVLVHGLLARIMSKGKPKAKALAHKSKTPPKVTRKSGKSERLNV